MKRLPLALLLAVALPASAQKAPVPDLLKRAFTPPASKQLYAYDFEDISSGGTAKEQRRSIVRGRIDPSRKKGDRVTITFAEQTGGKEPADHKKIDERYERNADGDIFCDGLSENSMTNVVDKGSTSEGRLFSFTPKAKPGADGQLKDIMKKMTALALIDEASAAVRSFNATLTKKHNIMLVSDIKAASMNAVCALAPNGRAHASEVEFIISGAGLGQAFDSKTVQKISNVTPAG